MSWKIFIFYKLIIYPSEEPPLFGGLGYYFINNK